MAASAREPTAVARRSPAPTTALSAATTAAATAAAAADALPSSPRLAKGVSPAAPPRGLEPINLTGAAAEADNRRHDQELERRKVAPLTSPNPALTSSSPFVAQPISRLSDAPRPAAERVGSSDDHYHNNNNDTTTTITMSDAPPTNHDAATAAAAAAAAAAATTSSTGNDASGNITHTGMVDEPMEMDQTPVSPSSAVPQLRTTQPSSHQEDSNHAPLAHDERSNKAVTYPPPPHPYDETPTRGHSYPNPSSTGRSSSTKKHKCPHCNTEFTRHHNLKSHLLTHSQEKPFSCNTCNHRFRRLHDLKRHTKLHTGERPHICIKCGRKFARGDALARHSKGPGGCAGRRGSAGGDDDDGDDAMEGLAYADDDGSAERRQSEPHSQRRSTLSQQDASPSLHAHASQHHSSTYPGQKALNTNHSPYPQSSVQSPGLLSPHTGHSGAYFNTAPPAYMQGTSGGVTESPKPLSPGTSDVKRTNGPLDNVYSRPRSPSLATHLQHQHLGRSTSHSGPSLPPPMPSSVHSSVPNGTTLPLPPIQPSGPGLPPPAISTHALPSAPASNPASASSQHQSSAGSMRDILNTGPSATSGAMGPDLGLWDQIRNLNADNAKLREELARVRDGYKKIQETLDQCQNDAHISEQHYETKIRRLEGELKAARR